MTSTEHHTLDPGAVPFLPFAVRIARRLRLIAWLQAVRASAWPVLALLLVALAAALLARWNGHPTLLRPLFPLTTALLLLWVIALSARILLPRLDPAMALAVFDERSGDHERFLSAHCLGLDPTRDVGATLHVHRTLADLPRAQAQLAEVLPVRLAPALFVLTPALFTVVLLACLDVSEPLHAVAETPKASLQVNEPATTPTPAAPDRSALDRRAAAATRLAAETGSEAEQAGQALLSTLARHAETAPLATALSAQTHGQAAEQAGRLAKRLRADNLSSAARQRIESALHAGLEHATPSDRKTQLGVQLERAHSALAEDRNQQAADALEKIAQRLRRVDRNARTQKALERVAKDHRKQKAPQGEPRRLPGLPPNRLSGLSSHPHTALPGGHAGTRPGQPGPAGGPASDGQADENTPGEGTADGRRPGAGSAPYGDTPTAPLPSTHDEAVEARIGKEGESQRLKQDPRDQPDRARPNPLPPMQTHFSKVSEAALVSDTLPLSRRALVLQYLEALRERFDAATDGRKR